MDYTHDRLPQSTRISGRRHSAGSYLSRPSHYGRGRTLLTVGTEQVDRQFPLMAVSPVPAEAAVSSSAWLILSTPQPRREPVIDRSQDRKEDTSDFRVMVNTIVVIIWLGSARKRSFCCSDSLVHFEFGSYREPAL